MQCENCGGEMKLVPAGISRKTNKHYNAFFACQNNQCGHTQQVQATGAPARGMNNLQQKTNDQKDLEKATGMVRHGFAIESYKMGKKLDPITAREVNSWTNFVMTGQLLTTPTSSTTAQRPIDPMPVIQVEDEYSQPEPEEINVASIPF